MIYPRTPRDLVPDDVVEAYVEELVQDDPGEYATCCDSTKTHWVEYGATTVPLPSFICGCAYEGAEAQVEEDIVSGELVLTTAGRLVFWTTALPLKDVVTSADRPTGG